MNKFVKNIAGGVKKKKKEKKRSYEEIYLLEWINRFSGIQMIK